MLNMDGCHTYRFSSFRFFQKHEHHMERTFREDVLLLVMDGTLRFCENDTPVEVGKGEFYIQRRWMHQTGPEESDMPKYFFIHFVGDFASSKNMLPLRGEANMTALFPLMQQLETLRVSGAPEVLKCAVFYQILSELFNTVKSSPSRELMVKVMTLVSMDMRRTLTLEDIAASCGYSRNHIIYAFKRETGMTPYAYILRLRLDAAKNLLMNSQLSVEQIAVECGFGNYINMYKEFKRQEHCSPTKWHNAGR